MYLRIREGKKLSFKALPLDESQLGTELDEQAAKKFAREIGLNPDYDLIYQSSRTDGRSRNTVQTLHDPNRMERKLSGLRDRVRKGNEEMGINTLYAAYGFLEWYESDTSNKANLAPLIMQPLEISREIVGGRYTYKLTSTGEDAQENITLAQRLLQFGLELPEIGEGTEPEAYFKMISAIIEGKPRWNVRRFVTVGIFEFGRLVMWNDLDSALWSKAKPPLSENTIISKILLGSEQSENSLLKIAEIYEIDSPETRGKLPPIVLDADPSQLSAIIDAEEGNNLVITGPPGTGKSQTITNMIAAALNSGKSVLFIAEKMAALEVVKKRLDDSGIGQFCFELHSTRATRTNVLEQLRSRVRIEPSHHTSPRGTVWELEQVAKKGRKFRTPLADQNSHPEVEMLSEARNQLNNYANLLNYKVGKTEYTIQELMWIEINSRRCAKNLPKALEAINDFPSHEMTPAEQQRVIELLDNLEHADHDIMSSHESREKHPWFGLDFEEMNTLEHNRVVGETQDMIENIDRHRNIAEALSKTTGLIAPDAKDEFDLFVTELKRLPQQVPAHVSATAVIDLCEDALFDQLKIMAGLVEEQAQVLNEIERICEDAHTLMASPKKLQELACAVAQHAVGYVKVSDLPTHYHDLESKTKTFASIMHHGKKLGDLFGISDPNATTLSTLVQCANLLEDTDDNILRNRSHLCRTNLTADLERARNTAKSLEEQELVMQKVVDTTTPLDIDELKKCAHTLRSTGLFGKLKSNYWHAKKRARQICHSPKPAAAQELAELVHKLAVCREKKEDFRNDSQIKSSLGVMFSGTESNFALIQSVIDFGENARNLTSRLFQEAPIVNNVMFDSSLDYVIAIVNRIPRKERDCLLEQLSNCPQDLCGTSEKLSSELHALNSIWKLAYDIKMHPSCMLAMAERLLELADRYRNIEADLSTLAAATKFLFTHGFERTDLQERICPALNFVSLVKDIFRNDRINYQALQGYIFSEMIAHRLDVISRFSSEIDAAENAFRSKLDSVNFSFAKTRRFLGVDPSLAMPTGMLRARLQEAVNFPSGLISWTRFAHAQNQVVKWNPNIGRMLSAYGDNIPLARLSLAFKRMFVCSALSYAYREHPSLKDMTGQRHEQGRVRFKNASKAVREIQCDAIIDGLKDCSPPTGISSGPRGSWTEQELIKHQISLVRPSCSIRSLMQRAGKATQALMPCFMMSPSSVAQFLPPSRLQFDLVIIDEASQMRPEEAIGALGRCRQAVVVGDQKQLPPTSFFQRIEDQQDDTDPDEDFGVTTDSILDLALHTFKPRDLRWHYRSRHESLIAFSNKHFYDNRLIVFPSPSSSDDLGVRFHFVNGVYRGKGENEEEVLEITNAAVRCMMSHPDNSLGIATLNMRQQQQIRERMEILELYDEKVCSYIARWKKSLEPFFVKNLENVQGDERDIIMVSTVFGPDAQGNFHQRFGPITGKAGHRRLNVLFTRAKMRIEIFSSMQSNMINIRESSPEGVATLKRYLEYAATGTVLGKATGRPPESPFEIEVSDYLRSFHYHVEAQVGVEGYRIDLAVVHPKMPSGYLLGIECDGATYHSSKSANERDIQRQQILENLGWNIYRIWSTDWFADREGQGQRLIDHIERLAKNGKRRKK